MAIAIPEKAKGLVYTDTTVTSGDMDSTYDVMVDFTNSQVYFVYASSSGDEKQQILKSILTYMQENEPTDPEYGDVWIKPSTGALKIYRTSMSWENWDSYNTDMWFLDTNDDLMIGSNPSANSIWELDGNGDVMVKTGLGDAVTGDYFETQAGNEVRPLAAS